MTPRGRKVERSAVWAIVPVLAMVPFSLLALYVMWLPVGWLTPLAFRWVVLVFAALGSLLFIRPFQVSVLTPLLGARRPTPSEADTIEPLWTAIAEANSLSPDRYVVRIVDSDELNAFACGGHLVVVTTFAIERLSRAELQGVLAHEISHHLGLHTVSITIGHWLSAPPLLLARVGFYLENVAVAASRSFGERSPLVDAASTVVASLMRGASWIFTAGLRAADALANIVGHEAEFEADQRAVAMGFGRELASALRRVLAGAHVPRPIGWRARIAASHPPARTRVARIEALLRHPAR
ncbi:peptidase M48 family protein [Ilumatobacter coccineus YM16-304]|uniref:Peptidase M48 family protein n=1 Tax=Ilumatobacter coccineus (strain NBRC 103263 / KCTC 29153 / YM16-304) TaxID=1313172 RepID=A0A6C7EAF1_ILUCY|nr:peptidase M48 family protein [Ilumatobacter coccineus YM16-304]